MTGSFVAWLASSVDQSVACSLDADGYYTMPLRCAIVTLRGRFDDTDRAYKAQYVEALACSDWPWEKVATMCGIGPHWVQEVATIDAIRSVWELYIPMPRG